MVQLRDGVNLKFMLIFTTKLRRAGFSYDICNKSLFDQKFAISYNNDLNKDTV